MTRPPAPIPDNSNPKSGSYQPAIGTTTWGQGCLFPGLFPTPAPAGLYGLPSMSVFNGTNPKNGGWKNFVDSHGKPFKSQNACTDFVENNDDQGNDNSH